MTCIYCGAPGPLSREHWFPEAFGSFAGFKPLLDRVCSKCNGLTKVPEQALARYGTTGIYRSLLGIRGKKRKEDNKRSPFSSGIKGIPAQDLMVSFPGVPCDLFGECDDFGNARPIPQIVIKREGQFKPMRLPHWVKSPGSFKKFLRTNDIAESHIRHFVAQDAGRTKRLFETLRPEGSGSISAHNPSPRVRIKWTVATGELNARAVAKIAFHYLLAAWGNKYTGVEAEFTAIKAFIMGKDPIPWDGRRHTQRTPYKGPERGEFPKELCHSISLRRSHEDIRARICFFILDKDPQAQDTWDVLLGNAPGLVVWEDTIEHRLHMKRGEDKLWIGRMIGPLL